MRKGTAASLLVLCSIMSASTNAGTITLNSSGSGSATITSEGKAFAGNIPKEFILSLSSVVYLDRKCVVTGSATGQWSLSTSEHGPAIESGPVVATFRGNHKGNSSAAGAGPLRSYPGGAWITWSAVHHFRYGNCSPNVKLSVGVNSGATKSSLITADGSNIPFKTQFFPHELGIDVPAPDITIHHADAVTLHASGPGSRTTLLERTGQPGPLVRVTATVTTTQGAENAINITKNGGQCTSIGDNEKCEVEVNSAYLKLGEEVKGNILLNLEII